MYKVYLKTFYRRTTVAVTNTVHYCVLEIDCLYADGWDTTEARLVIHAYIYILINLTFLTLICSRPGSTTKLPTVNWPSSLHSISFKYVHILLVLFVQFLLLHESQMMIPGGIETCCISLQILKYRTSKNNTSLFFFCFWVFCVLISLNKLMISLDY